MDAQSIGLTDNQIVLGKHSGRNAFRTRLKELGFENITDLDGGFGTWRNANKPIEE